MTEGIPTVPPAVPPVGPVATPPPGAVISPIPANAANTQTPAAPGPVDSTALSPVPAANPTPPPSAGAVTATAQPVAVTSGYAQVAPLPTNSAAQSWNVTTTTDAWPAIGAVTSRLQSFEATVGTPGLQTSEGKLVYGVSGLIQLFVLVWGVLLGAGAIHPDMAIAAAVPGVGQALVVWLASQYSGDRTALKQTVTAASVARGSAG